MPRRMSCRMTVEPVRRREKRVSRRLGWQLLEPGDRLTLVEQAQGLRKGEKQVVLAPVVEVLSNSPEQLDWLIDGNHYTPQEAAREMELEGFPGMDPREFVAMFCAYNRCAPDVDLQRIEWEYLS